ncbi:MAG: hypothetical protein KME17_27230 [Cyanosarcina radialis HA8281-LM2]|nr:hypothetical protein [Cyanosarcina radialis HA8281-LM2]
MPRKLTSTHFPFYFSLLPGLPDNFYVGGCFRHKFLRTHDGARNLWAAIENQDSKVIDRYALYLKYDGALQMTLTLANY